jgi:hypothetical protein
MYYILLSMINPQEPSYYYYIGKCLMKENIIIEALCYYSLYLYYSPEAEERNQIEEFFKSREISE